MKILTKGFLLFALSCSALFAPVSGVRAADLTVHAAASLTDALKELTPLYTKASGGDQLRCNFGASSLLARQIKEGAPGDVFLSADEAQMDGLDKAGLLAPGTRRSLLGNTLVIVVPAEGGLPIKAAADLANRADIRRVAIAEPSSVPVGVYAKEYLTKLGLWERVRPKVVPTDNVRASLSAVEGGNVEAGVVYRTDALISKAVKVAYEVPAAEGPKITYPLAVLKESKDPAAARKLAAFLAGPEAAAVFGKYGFTVLK